MFESNLRLVDQSGHGTPTSPLANDNQTVCPNVLPSISSYIKPHINLTMDAIHKPPTHTQPTNKHIQTNT